MDAKRYAPNPCAPCRGVYFGPLGVRHIGRPRRRQCIPFTEQWFMGGGPHHGERVRVYCPCSCRQAEPEVIVDRERARAVAETRARSRDGDSSPHLPGAA